MHRCSGRIIDALSVPETHVATLLLHFYRDYPHVYRDCLLVSLHVGCSCPRWPALSSTNPPTQEGALNGHHQNLTLTSF